MVIEDKQDLIDSMNGLDYGTKVKFTIDGVEYEGDLDFYGGDLEPQVIEICLNPKDEPQVKNSFNDISNSTIILNLLTFLFITNIIQ